MEMPRLFGRQGNNPLSPGDVEEEPTLPTTSTTTALAPVSSAPAEGGQQANPGSGDTPGGSAQGAGDEDWAVRFNDTTNFPDASRVLDLLDGEGMSRFNFYPANASVRIENVTWRGRKIGGSSDVEIAKADLGLSGDLERPNDFLQDVNTQGAVLVYENFSDDEELQGFRASNMTISVGWRLTSSGNRRGETTSGYFTVASQADRAAGKLDDFQQLFDKADRQALVGEEVVDTGGGASRGGDTSSTTLPSAESSSVVPTGLQSDDSDDDGGGGGGGGGLSTGAIAGIAVAGAVIFLALIGGLIFFLLRRRRRSKARGQYGNPPTSTTFIPAGDKEVHQVTESPHSTYSNDQQVPLSNLAAAGGPSSRDAGAHHHHHHHHHDDDDAGYAPYRDDDAGAESPATGGRADSGAGTPRGVSRSVAHLVEDGMTEDEIRRLEEEERQLDDAIQRHGRRS